MFNLLYSFFLIDFWFKTMDIDDKIINNIELSDYKGENDFFGFEASKKKVLNIQKENIFYNFEAKTKYAANRVFVNNGDSYHGKYIIQVSLVLNLCTKYI